ncbi:hypothetical protein ACFFJY_19640 [Fictibacillus aquaticus]|uniref:Lipoprotein n=1 Tax=Fictibacillus aquaticus TaxID=2021314 RepID=A0A235F559_9BACL|nr:hypothetical protein [Fictibacillus aquaticus]OYD56389.1 hypothetical protein CGZ90_17705 [Fictibacillus aquaticus]
MNKIKNLILLVSLACILVSCGSPQTEKPQAAKAPEVKAAKIEDAVSVIKKETPTDYKLIEHKPYHFTGQKTPEVYALYRPDSVTEGDFTINIIRVYQFNKDKNAWEGVFNQSITDKMQLTRSMGTVLMLLN